MPWLTPDDDVRRLEAVWVEMQPTARFVAWGVWLGASLVAAPVLAFVLPVGVVVAGCALAVYLTRQRDRLSLMFAVLLAVLAFLVIPLGSLLHPLPWLVALLLAPVIGVLVARLLMGWVRYETPVRYWLDVVQAEAGGYRGTASERVKVNLPSDRNKR